MDQLKNMLARAIAKAEGRMASTKNPAAALGRLGSLATAKNRTAKQRRAAARKAILARWAKVRVSPR